MCLAGHTVVRWHHIRPLPGDRPGSARLLSSDGLPQGGYGRAEPAAHAVVSGEDDPAVRHASRSPRAHAGRGVDGRQNFGLPGNQLTTKTIYCTRKSEKKMFISSFSEIPTITDNKDERCSVLCYL